MKGSPEDEEQDHERTGAADQRLGENARPLAAAGRGLIDRVSSGERSLDAGRSRRLQPRADLFDMRRRGETGSSGRVDLGERRVPVLGDIGAAAGGPERGDAGARVDLRCGGDRSLDAGRLRHVAGAVEYGDERRLLARAERLERSLIRLVRRVAGNREALEPTLRDLTGRKRAEQRQQHPDADHGTPATDDQVGEARESRHELLSSIRFWTAFELLDRAETRNLSVATSAPSTGSGCQMGRGSRRRGHRADPSAPARTPRPAS